MSKVEEVRAERIAAQKALEEECHQVFEWILEWLREKTKKFEFEPLEVKCNTSGTKTVVSVDPNNISLYDIKNYVSDMYFADVNVLLRGIKKMFDSQKGFTAEIRGNNSKGDQGNYLFVNIE